MNSAGKFRYEIKIDSAMKLISSVSQTREAAELRRQVLNFVNDVQNGQ